MHYQVVLIQPDPGWPFADRFRDAFHASVEEDLGEIPPNIRYIDHTNLDDLDPKYPVAAVYFRSIQVPEQVALD